MDARSRAEELLTSILSAKTPKEIASVLSSTLSFLRVHPPDQCRHFFSHTFPPLLSRLFFPSSSPSSPPWIDLPEPLLLSSLLSPSGPLLSTLLSLDLLHPSPILYSFPLERLPFWIPFAIPHSRSHHLSPLLLSRALPDPPRLHLSPFDYYLLWFAYHPIFHPSSPRGGLYPRLLLAYLRTFVPLRRDVPAPVLQRALFVVDVFVHFWMVDNDFSPFPDAKWKSLRLEPLRRRVPPRAPPSPDLEEVLHVLVKYVNSGLVGPLEEGGVRGLNPGRTWNSVIRRPLYRYILRSFLFLSTKNAWEVVSLWMAYLEPWKTGVDESSGGFELPVEWNRDGGSNKESRGSEGWKEGCSSELCYNRLWSDYVGSNYLFYSSLVVHFLGFALKSLHIDVEMVVQMTLKVICILTSPGLLDLLGEIDASYHSKSAVNPSAPFSSSHKYISTIGEQLQDWEDGLCENEAGGSFLHENWNRELKLFSESGDGARKLLQHLILRAEPELRATSGDNGAENLQNLESLKYQMSILFGGRSSTHAPPEPRASPHVVHGQEVFLPSRPHIDKHRRDRMRQSISDWEVAWLVRFMVRLSDWLNEKLGLDRNASDEHMGPTYLVVPSLDIEIELGAKEVFWKLSSFIGNCMVMLAHTVLKFMRAHGWRINLRLLASKKFVLALLLPVFIGVLWKVL